MAWWVYWGYCFVFCLFIVCTSGRQEKSVYTLGRWTFLCCVKDLFLSHPSLMACLTFLNGFTLLSTNDSERPWKWYSRAFFYNCSLEPVVGTHLDPHPCWENLLAAQLHAGMLHFSVDAHTCVALTRRLHCADSLISVHDSKSKTVVFLMVMTKLQGHKTSFQAHRNCHTSLFLGTSVRAMI